MTQALLLERHYIHSRLITLKFKISGVSTYQPGQFFTFELDAPSKLYRSYSVSQVQGDIYHFAVALVPGGKGSKILQELAVGRSISVLGPFGDFTWEIPSSDSHITLIASHTGIAPFYSMFDLILESQVPVTLLYGVKQEKDLLYIPNWKNLQSRCDFSYKIRISDDQSQYPLGRVTDDLKNICFNSKDLVYICGNPYMINDVYHWIQKRFSPKIKIERFG